MVVIATQLVLDIVIVIWVVIIEVHGDTLASLVLEAQRELEEVADEPSRAAVMLQENTELQLQPLPRFTSTW
jgi:hypothetical protein